MYINLHVCFYASLRHVRRATAPHVARTSTQSVTRLSVRPAPSVSRGTLVEGALNINVSPEPTAMDSQVFVIFYTITNIIMCRMYSGSSYI